MAIEYIPINTGTGPQIAVDSAGSEYYQIVKISTAGDGTAGGLFSGTGNVIITNTPVVTATVGGTVAVSAITTGTVDVVAMPVLSATNVTVASVATGTMNVVSMPVLSATNVTIASIATGTVTVKNATLAVVATAHPQRLQFYAIATTSAATGVIIQTSGGHTLYITDLLLSVDGPMDVTLASETTAFGKVFLATKGGFTINMVEPYACSSADSFRVLLSSSGACAVSGVGYTVT